MTENTRVEPEALSEATGAWTLDPRRTTIQFQTRSMWVLTVDGTLQASEGHGVVDDNGQITGRIVIDTTTVDTKNKRRDVHLRDADFFDVLKYPTMVFDVTGVRLDAPGRCSISGTLTIRGVTRPVEFPAALRMEGDGSITLGVRTEVDRSKWGMSWAKIGTGLDNQVTIEATFVRRDMA